MRRKNHLAHKLLPLYDLLSIHYPVRLNDHSLRRAFDDRVQLVATRIPDDQFKEKSIQLSFRQRVCPFLFDRVLRRHDKEWRIQLVYVASNADRPLLHRLEKGGLRLRRRPIDLIRQTNLSEERTFLELKLAPPGLILDNHVRAQNIRGHQIGRELNSREIKI